MTKRRLSFVLVLVPVVCSAVVSGCATTSKKQAKSLTIAEADGGNGVVVTISESLARSVLEGVVGSELECGAEMDPEFAAMLRELDREGRGGRAAIRDEDGALTARRSGRSLKMEFDDADGGGLEVKMPWAVAECLLDGSSTLSARDAASVQVEIRGAEGGSFSFEIDD